MKCPHCSTEINHVRVVSECFQILCIECPECLKDIKDWITKT